MLLINPEDNKINQISSTQRRSLQVSGGDIHEQLSTIWMYESEWASEGLGLFLLLSLLAMQSLDLT